MLLIIKVFFFLGSKRSAHSNAYFYGFFNSKRIVLYDTLFKDNKDTMVNQASGDEVKDGEINENIGDKEKGMTEDEILAVLCHELGHWKLNHVLFNIVISQV